MTAEEPPVRANDVERRHGPWVDVHAHPGRCFLAGLEPGDVLAAGLGGEGCDRAIAEVTAAGMAAVSFATVADLRVIGVRKDGGLDVVRRFDEGEAYADHVRQLAAIVGLAVGLTLLRSPGTTATIRDE